MARYTIAVFSSFVCFVAWATYVKGLPATDTDWGHAAYDSILKANSDDKRGRPSQLAGAHPKRASWYDQWDEQTKRGRMSSLLGAHPKRGGVESTTEGWMVAETKGDDEWKGDDKRARSAGFAHPKRYDADDSIPEDKYLDWMDWYRRDMDRMLLARLLKDYQSSSTE